MNASSFECAVVPFECCVDLDIEDETLVDDLECGYTSGGPVRLDERRARTRRVGGEQIWST